MSIEKKTIPEFWLRGPLPGLSPFLQPVAHALLQAREEVREIMERFPGERLWERPGGVASVGFHLQHLAGVLDRLFTYARGEVLGAGQLTALEAEGDPPSEKGQALSCEELVDHFALQVDLALEQLLSTPEPVLTDAREVGRARLASTVLGLLVHAAEHTQRHTGQLLVTVRLLLALPAGPLPIFLQQGGEK
jgi:uncharacterized damage-inducible protein DinB